MNHAPLKKATVAFSAASAIRMMSLFVGFMVCAFGCLLCLCFVVGVLCGAGGVSVCVWGGRVFGVSFG